MTDFIDLNRRFFKASDSNNAEASAQQSYLIADLLGSDGSLGWSDLLKKPLTVILGEPGSGKTTELRFQADRLRRQAQKAFFVRLDRLVEEPLMAVLGKRDQADFQKWEKRYEKAYFFFDSVDESKLRKPDDFLTALQRISDAIGIQELRRACLIFSSRISEWRPVTDMDELMRLFPVFYEARDSKKDESQDTLCLFKQNVGDDLTEQQSDKETHQTGPLMVHIAPLDIDRVRRFAKWRGLTDPETFIEALHAHHAWEFARRPLDVNGLIEFWRSHGRLGSLTELIEHSVTLSLRESEERETRDPLTPATARQGAQALAAAALLCRNMNFKVPDDQYVSTAGTTALDAANCLPATWSPAERRALLTRPLFDGATYGCIRFHHRRTMEYLVASWLNNRMKDGCPQDRLDELLFAQHQGHYILRPILAPVAAWLANGNEPHNMQVRRRLLETEAGIHFKYGDPEQLPIEYKRRVLSTLSSRYADRDRTWMDTDPEALARLADPALAADISAIIRNPRVAGGLRADMLLLVRYGRLADCLEAALEIFAEPAESEEIKSYALLALLECENVELRKRLAAITSTMPSVSSSLAGLLCETLYPEVINADDLFDLMQKIETSPHHSFDLPWTLNRHFQKKLTSNAAASLLQVFLRLLRTPPHQEHHRRDEPISQRFRWLCDVLPVVLNKLLEKKELSFGDTQLTAESLRILDADWTHSGHSDDKELKQISNAIKRHPVLKSEFFWQGVERYRAANQKEPEWFHQIIGFRSNLVKIEGKDMEWLVNDVSRRQSVADRSLALHFAFELWWPYSLQWKPWFHLLGLSLSKPGWRWLFCKYSFRSLIFPAKAFWFRYIQYKLLDRCWWKGRSYKIQHVYNWIREQYMLHRYLFDLYSGKEAHWLSNLSREAQRKTGSARWAADDWSSLKKKRAPLVAWASRHGCEKTWVKHIPLLPHEKDNPNQTSSFTIAGLCGLQSLWHRKKLDFSALSETDATHAARYAMNELNGFADCLPELASAKPQAVRNILIECIQGEWQIPPEREHVFEVLHKLQSYGQRYWQLIASELLAQLQIQDPKHPQVLDYAVSILLKSPHSPHSELVALASLRAETYPLESRFFLTWMALWLQLEAQGAITYLTSRMNGLSASQADKLILLVCDSLRGDSIDSTPHVASPDYFQPHMMKIWIQLVYRHIRPSEDPVHRTGEGYRVTQRDHAREYRDGLLQLLAQVNHSEILAVLKDLQSTPELIAHRDWIAHLIEQHIHQMVDLPPWQAQEIRSFTEHYETDPRNDADLFRIACWRLQDIKHEVEQSENSLRDEVHENWDETDLRRWFQRKLNERSRQRYTIPQEAEIDQGQKPDLRFEHPKIPSNVPVELKWADKWTTSQLLERLENQLVGQYLRACNVRYGIYLLGYIGRKQWDHPTEQRRIDFSELVSLIKRKVQELEENRPDLEGIRVIDIDFRAK